MSDDMATHRGKRRNIRRLTRRKIELPSAGSSLAPPGAAAMLSAAASEPPDEGDDPSTNADGSVASSLAELRLPSNGEGSPGAAAAANGGREASAGETSDATPAKPSLAASELSDEEPATNPHLRVDAELPPARPPAASIAFGDARGSDRPDGAPNGTQSGTQSGAQSGAAGSGNGLAKEDAANNAHATSDTAAASSTFDESEPATGQHRKPGAPGAKSQPAPRRPDSDAPTRPRIELSSDMAFAAGRVTSLDLPPVRDEPRRGSKIPPISGEPRMISSLTGRRSSIPVSSEEDDAAARPAVVVTRSKIISDRPPRPDAELNEKAAETEPAAVTSIRPSRRPGGVEGDDFETLDIDDGEVESRGEPEIDVDTAPAKAPPPPPKRAAVLPPAAPGAPPKAAPPPPPRAPGAQLAAAAPVAVASMPSPTPPAATALAGSTVTAASSAAAPAPAGGAGAAPRKPGGRQQPRRRQWWETLFSDEYLRTVVRPTSAQIARQVDFMQASLGVGKGAALLDVGCGLGQHALEFARRGCLVVALDLALPMITRAAEDAQQEGLRINFLHKDIRDIGFEGTFDAVVCVGTTFGFFDDEQNREVLGRLANALKPGGRLLLEVVNRDHVLGSQPNLQWFEGDGCVVMEESDFNYYSSRLTVKRTMMREDGRQTEGEYSIRLYALHELGQMMNQAGFRVKEVSGAQATRGVFFGAQSNRIILLAERRTSSPTRGNGHGTSDVPLPPSDS